ncbi:CaiB/BaiF CoA-transferase family protein [Paralimibaculum aggregatum]|uniref:CaiB/BaiF CoA-transferase family protein n=1 Tax=Paralimibaculum aggregatum TaxID=3036245 RepID=A0ABQ6LGD8_9RHOB|nr:CaiB/BaiF CoA-transferase family protein [Limibaculum sp. NKW23]GMG82384.1 CaiB/BaiF CoA-transferase family protein [Limibaculum sp. NKW23]
MTETAEGPLAGLTVVAVEQAVAAPYASSRLADAGARVIKIERETGDFARAYDTLARGQSAYFVWLNRGKESVCLDLRDGADIALLRRMILSADVLIQNLKPGALGRMGLAPAALRAEAPGLITCSISGFGEAGPYASLKAYDLIVQAETGLCAITGTADGPARVGVSVCDIAAGMSAHAAILEALIARGRTGLGRQIEVSLFDAVADWMNVPFLQRSLGGRETRRAGVQHPSLAPYGAYRCADGLSVIFSVQNDREWVAFCAGVLGDETITRAPEFADNMARLANREALERLVAARFAALTGAEAMELLERVGLACGRLNDIDALIAHPALRTVSVPTEAGPLDVIAPPALVAGAAPEMRPVPRLGEHSAAIRAEFAG